MADRLGRPPRPHQRRRRRHRTRRLRRRHRPPAPLPCAVLRVPEHPRRGRHPPRFTHVAPARDLFGGRRSARGDVHLPRLQRRRHCHRLHPQRAHLQLLFRYRRRLHRHQIGPRRRRPPDRTPFRGHRCDQLRYVPRQRRGRRGQRNVRRCARRHGVQHRHLRHQARHPLQDRPRPRRCRGKPPLRQLGHPQRAQRSHRPPQRLRRPWGRALHRPHARPPQHRHKQRERPGCPRSGENDGPRRAAHRKPAYPQPPRQRPQWHDRRMGRGLRAPQRTHRRPPRPAAPQPLRSDVVSNRPCISHSCRPGLRGHPHRRSALRVFPRSARYRRRRAPPLLAHGKR